MIQFRLFHKDQELGSIVDLSGDQPWMIGTLDPPQLREPFRELYEFMAVEENYDQDPPVDPELLEDENWYLLDASGKRWEIWLPAIDPQDFSVSWRWRGEIPSRFPHGQ